MNALRLLLVMIMLVVMPVGSVAQEPTGTPPSNLPSEEAQDATKAPPPQSTALQSTPAGTRELVQSLLLPLLVATRGSCRWPQAH